MSQYISSEYTHKNSKNKLSVSCSKAQFDLDFNPLVIHAFSLLTGEFLKYTIKKYSRQFISLSDQEISFIVLMTIPSKGSSSTKTHLHLQYILKIVSPRFQKLS